jgi:hypothetical protein
MRLNSVSAPYFVQFNLTFPGELRRVGACTRYSHSSEFKSNFPRFHNFRLYHRMKGLRWARREKYPDKENHEPAAEKGRIRSRKYRILKVSGESRLRLSFPADLPPRREMDCTTCERATRLDPRIRGLSGSKSRCW